MLHINTSIEFVMNAACTKRKYSGDTVLVTLCWTDTVGDTVGDTVLD